MNQTTTSHTHTSGLICIGRSKHSDYVRQTLSAGESIDLMKHNYFWLNEFIQHGHDPAKKRMAIQRWKHFVGFLKSHKLRMTSFDLASVGDDYLMTYILVSTVHRNQAFKNDVFLPGSIPFNFVPGYFVEWIIPLVDQAPYDDMIMVANGF